MIPKYYAFWPRIWSHTISNSSPVHRKFPGNTELIYFDRPSMIYIYFRSSHQVPVSPKIATNGSFLIMETPAITPANLLKQYLTHSLNIFKALFAAKNVCLLSVLCGYCTFHIVLLILYYMFSLHLFVETLWTLILLN